MATSTEKASNNGEISAADMLAPPPEAAAQIIQAPPPDLVEAPQPEPETPAATNEHAKKKASTKKMKRAPKLNAEMGTAGITVAVPLSLKTRFEWLAVDYKAKNGRRVTLEALYTLALERGIPSYEELEELLADDEE